MLTIYNTEIQKDDYGRYCLNDLHKAAGGESRHKPSEWMRNKQTTELINEIEIAGIPAIESKQQVGTFAVKELVYAYAMWVSPKFHLAVIRAYDAMVTQHVAQPDDQVRSALTLLEGAARMLNYSETSKIKGLTVIANHYHLPTKMLPAYVEEVSVTRALGDLLKDHSSKFSAVRVNPILEGLGIITKLSRRTSKGATRNFWNITEAGLAYGKNEICAQYPNETQPRWYVDKFPELLALVEAQIPSNVVTLHA